MHTKVASLPPLVHPHPKPFLDYRLAKISPKAAEGSERLLDRRALVSDQIEIHCGGCLSQLSVRFAKLPKMRADARIQAKLHFPDIVHEGRFTIWQLRVTQGGSYLKICKWRTMDNRKKLDNHNIEKHLQAEGGKSNDDPRFTPMGRFLRKYHFDEIPQIISFFRKELVAVGIRPYLAVELLTRPFQVQEKILAERPGLGNATLLAPLSSDPDAAPNAEMRFFRQKNRAGKPGLFMFWSAFNLARRLLLEGQRGA